MKKLFLLAMIALASVGINAQTVKGEGSLMGNIGYQTNYERFGLGVQGRYAIANNLRIAPDVTFYFPTQRTFVAENQPYNKITVQLSVKEKRE